MNKSIIFSTPASHTLANNIAKASGNEIGNIYHHQFPSGEWYCQLKENVRGADVFLIQPLVNPVNDNLMQLLIMADACRRASAGRIIAITPYLGYSRQDRKDKSRVPISAKLVMDIMEAAGINRIVTMDLHAAQIQGFTNLPFDHLYFRPVLINALKDEHIDVVVSPDIGAIKRADDLARYMGKELAFISKRRISDSEVKAQQFVGNVNGKNVLVVDDLTESAGTLIEAATVCKKEGANKVFCAVTHNCLNSLGRERLVTEFNKGTINKFYCSNSCMPNLGETDCLEIIDIAPLMGEVIRKINTNESVSELF